ncbi:MAG: glycerophosphodiester phosphodiesterase family protein [Chloroflexi bacterium]|nr:glycerophosphodiester phosphodiesterase family protein [Chloroflexota bacterium]
MDVHATQDGVLVLMHDDTVDRTTDGSGAIQAMTLAEIKALDAGHYWTDDDGQTYP